MKFDEKLLGKILDPIHGTIMITDIERKVIGHRLFQRLRNVKQNTFLYKVFPSAMHSRFEHSLGVMHVAYEMLNNLLLNSYRYNAKYEGENRCPNLDELLTSTIQELRLAALLHDIGHGPMSHQFDSFLMSKSHLSRMLGNKYTDVYDLINDEYGVEHEHISLIFIRNIIEDLSLDTDVDINNILKLIENKYKGGQVLVEFNGSKFDIQPLFTSLISSCPIDADRMDYLLRDSYFSGVKCGIYNIERLLKSIVPVLDGNKICLAYKESCLDSISEFVFSRSNLFSQVYFHKTNRAFSAMLAKVCDISLREGKECITSKIYHFKTGMEDNNLEFLHEFYIKNSDDEFINTTVPKLIDDSDFAKSLIDDIIDRKPWKKLYESKLYISDQGISSKVDKAMISNIKESLSHELKKVVSQDEFIIDIMSDNTFKDIDKTEIKLLVKSPDGSYEVKEISECGEKLDMYQSIRYFIRVYIKPITLENISKNLPEKLDNVKNSCL